MYSFGVLVWEVFSGGATPFGDLTVEQLVMGQQAGARLLRPSADTPDDVAQLIFACTAAEAALRPAMAAVSAALAAAWVMDDAEERGETAL